MTERADFEAWITAPPVVLNPPKRIWLNVGNIERDCNFDEFRPFEDLTWCQDKIDQSDVEYVLATEFAASQEALSRTEYALIAEQEHVLRLTQELERARGDAQRYRWLREQLDAQSLLCNGGDFFRHQPGTFDAPPLGELDVAIDAARAQDGELAAQETGERHNQGEAKWKGC